VLAENRGRGRRRPRRVGELDRLCHRPITPNQRMVERRDQVFGEDLRRIEHLLDQPHRRAGDAFAENLLPFEGAARGKRGAQLGHEFGRMRGAAAHRRAAQIAGQLRPADQLAQRGKEMVGVNRNIEPSVPWSDECR
jgi:hypothetical protein